MDRKLIRSPRWKIYLLALGVVGFVIAGFVLVFGDSTFAERLIGVVCVLFFGILGGRALYAMLIKGGGSVVVSDQGVELNYPDVPPILLPWQDIEGFGVRKNKADAFTTIRLKRYDHLLHSTSREGIKAYVKKVKYVKALAKILAVAAAIEIAQTRGVLRQMPKDDQLAKVHCFPDPFQAAVWWGVPDSLEHAGPQCKCPRGIAQPGA